MNILFATYLVLSAIVLSGFVSATADITYNFNVNNVRVVIYDCLDSGCNSVSGPWFDQSTNTGSITVSYPTELRTPYGYAAYYFSQGYVPQAFNPTWHGTGTATYDINFNKIQNCYSPVDNLAVINTAYAYEPLVISYTASVSADIRSAFSEADNGVGYVPTDFIAEYYSADTVATLTIKDSNGVTVYSDSIEMTALNGNPLYMDEVRDVQFVWTPDTEGTYTIKISSDVIDNQCSSSIQQSSSKNTEVLPARPIDECYTILNNAVLSNDMPSSGETITISYDKISNYIDASGTTYTPVQTAITYQVFADGVLIDSSSANLQANSDPYTAETYSFDWTFTSGGNYNFVITGIANSPLCSGKTNIQDQISLEIFVPDTDTIPPAITIYYPLNITYPSAVTYMEFTATDPNLESCWYSTDGGITNVSISCSSGVLETVSITSVEGSNTWTVYARDSFGNEAFESVTFTVDTSGTSNDTTPPTITISYPQNTTYTSSVTYMEFTVTDDNLESCWYSTDGGATNISVSCTSGVTQNISLTSVEGTNTWTVYARDSFGNETFKSVTFTVDTSAGDGNSGTSDGTGTKSSSKKAVSYYQAITPAGIEEEKYTPIIELKKEAKKAFDMWTVNLILIILIILITIAIIITLKKKKII